jgi:hypothetical protein
MEHTNSKQLIFRRRRTQPDFSLHCPPPRSNACGCWFHAQLNCVRARSAKPLPTSPGGTAQIAGATHGAYDGIESSGEGTSALCVPYRTSQAAVENDTSIRPFQQQQYSTSTQKRSSLPIHNPRILPESHLVLALFTVSAVIDVFHSVRP